MAEDRVTWVECPRDAWQGLPHLVPTGSKALHLNHLLASGFAHLDMGSFVSPKAVPQLADTEDVLALIEATAGADLLCIVGNERGLQRAQAAEGVTSIGYPLSVNDTFQQRNLGLSVARSWPVVERLLTSATAAGLDLVVYVSMGFGNPYGQPWTPAVTAAAVAHLRRIGVKRIALADTVGNADAAAVTAVLGAVDSPESLGLHLHARPQGWRQQVDAGLEAGVRWFEGALGGIGGCPFAADELVGNLPTEEVLPYLHACGFKLTPDLSRLPELTAEARALATQAAL